LLIKYIKSVLWRVTKRLSYIEDARCLKVNIVSLDIHTVNLKKKISNGSLMYVLDKE